MAGFIKTYTLPVNANTTGTPPFAIARATNSPLRVLVRARGGAGAIALIGMDPNALDKVANVGILPDTFSLPVNDSETFIIDCGETLWAMSTAAGVQVSVAISEIPSLTSI